jgi:hypothetical protein
MIRRDLRDVPGIAHGDATESLYPLGNRVDQLDLLACVFIEQQVELVERCASHQPMVLFVEGVEDLRVCQELVQPLAE